MAPFAVFAAVPLALLPVLIRVFPLDAATDGSSGASEADSVCSAATWQRFRQLASYSRLLVLASVACTFACWSAFDLGFGSWLENADVHNVARLTCALSTFLFCILSSNSTTVEVHLS